MITDLITDLCFLVYSFKRLPIKRKEKHKVMEQLNNVMLQ